MPGIPVAPAVSAPAPLVSVKTGSTSARYSSPRKNSSPLVWIAGGAVALLVLPCFACGLIGVLADKGERTRSKPSPQRQVTTKASNEAEQIEIEAEANKRIAEMGLGSKVTYANFARVSTGMSRIEVCDILGFDYEIVSETGSGKYKTEMLSWKAGFAANCNVMFQNDKVISKAQLGLK